MVDLWPRRDHDSGKPMSIVEKTYLLNGEPVVVLVKRRHARVPKGVKWPRSARNLDTSWLIRKSKKVKAINRAAEW
jgi:hypothetical protein